MRVSLTCTLLILTAPVSAAELEFPSVPAVPAQRAHQTFHVLDGFEMQLVASEPLVTDPVAITYDEDGRAYVCEMTDYPYTDKAQHKPSQINPTDLPIGKVRLLEDTDADGTYDKSTLFAEGLSWPTGAVCWKGGIFVTATPDIWYLKDTTGDGKADVREKIFTGFHKLNVQAVMNNPQWGLDHRIYIAGGSNGATISRPDTPNIQAISIRRNDASFDPLSRDMRIESGGARFGNSFDDWGNRFLCNIRNPCQHIVLPYSQISRNPYLTVSSALNDCAEAGDQLPVYRTSPIEPWRDFRAKRWSNEGSTLPKSELIGAGVVTSSSGITIYRGDAYPEAYRNFAFVNDVAGNLFYRMKVVPEGITFKAMQEDGTKNFCTSDDIWFRPVNFTNAPDGCLHVCDMYREVIEHPWSIPEDIHASIDLLKGTDKGRIWRLTPKNHLARLAPKLSLVPTKELVALLDHPNGWHRDTAHRLIFERQDPVAITPLRTLISNAKTPQGKVQALWSLQGMQALSDQDLAKALNDPHPEVRAVAMSLGEGHWHSLINKAALAKLAQDPASCVQKQIAFQISTLLPFLADESLTDILQATERDPWLETTLLTLPSDSAKPLLAKVSRSSASNRFIRRLAAIAAQVSIATKDTADLLPLIAAPDARMGLIIGVDEGLRQKRQTLRMLSTDPVFIERLNGLAKLAIKDCLNTQGESEARLDALALLRATGEPEALLPVAVALMNPDQPPALQTAALDAIAGERSAQVAGMLIRPWKTLSPTLRAKALSALLSYPDRVLALLDAIETKLIPASQINAATRAMLTKNKDKGITERATQLFDVTNSNRAEVITRYAKAMIGPSGEDATVRIARGEKVYQMACLVCHKHGQQGNDVGPHLGTVQAWTPELLLTNILDPNREVSPNFALYLIETQDGRILSGIITSETADSLILKRADGGEESLTRRDIKSLSSTGTSLMPEGLEAAITPEQMADLITFLTSKN